MNLKKLTLSLLLCSAAVFSGFAKKDAVLMTVDGKDITVSEFEYLYNKNNAQQVEPQSLESYLDLFVNYRLKVADALRAKADTTQSFISEFEKYRDDLARPYISDRQEAERLRREAYAHRLRDVTVSHIMVSRNDGKAVADSLLSLIKSGKATFEDIARKASIDRPTARRGGLMGVVTAGRFPYAFEEMAFNTPVGEISEPVNSGFGWHIIRVEKSEPAKGEVNAAHILLLTRGASDEAKAKAKLRIDSIYQAAKGGADFTDLAKRFSQDPGSATRGGDLGWFGSGMMVQPFDSISFVLKPGEISEPFETAFGYHIIYKKDARGVAPFDELKKEIDAEIERDYRASLPVKAALRTVASRSGASMNESTIEALRTIIDADSATISEATVNALAQSKLPAYAIGRKEVSVAEVMKENPLPKGLGTEEAKALLRNIIENAYEKELFAIAEAELEKENTEYRNLLNEYRDGILLFDISNRKVWERATKDEAGLAEFFNKNRDRYTWEQPKFKSYVIFATNDSVLTQIKDYLSTVTAPVTDRDAFTKALRDKFGKDVKVERVIAARGENVITDYLGFGAAKPDVQSQRWPVYVAFRGKVISAPEEVADVRGAVVTDYQQALEAEWIKELHEKYPVKINRKQLKKIK